MICLRTGLPNFLSAQRFAIFQLMTFYRDAASRFGRCQTLEQGCRARFCFSFGQASPISPLYARWRHRERYQVQG